MEKFSILNRIGNQDLREVTQDFTYWAHNAVEGVTTDTEALIRAGEELGYSHQWHGELILIADNESRYGQVTLGNIAKLTEELSAHGIVPMEVRAMGEMSGQFHVYVKSVEMPNFPKLVDGFEASDFFSKPGFVSEVHKGLWHVRYNGGTGIRYWDLNTTRWWQN